MSVELTVRRVVLNAHRTYEWRFRDGVTVLVGPGSVGKTSLMNLIKYGMGGNAVLSPAVRSVGKQVCLELEVEGRRFGLKRNITSGRGRVDLVDAQGDLQSVLSADPGDDQRTPVSEYLLESVGIPSIEVPRSLTGASEELTRISFNDVLAYLYLDQDEIARSTVHHIDGGARDAKRRQTFELLYGIIDSGIARLRREQVEINAARERVAAEINAIRPFLERAGQPSQADLDVRAAALTAQLDAVERELALLRARVGEASEPSGDVRDQLRLLELRRPDAERRLNEARGEAAGLRRVRAQLVQDLNRAVRSTVAAPLFAGFEFETCPRCLQSLELTHEHGKCKLCGQHEPEQPVDYAALLAERTRVEAQISETEELLGDAEQSARTLELALHEFNAEASGLRDVLDRQTREAVAPFVDSMGELSERQGALRAERDGLEASRRFLREAEALDARAATLRERAGELGAALDVAEAQQDDARQRVTELSEIFSEILAELKLPWLREAYVDGSTYLPMVNDERLEDLSSGSMKAIVNSAYFLAGLTFAIRGYPTLLPRFMMIDSPRVHHGNSTTDRDAGGRVYRWLVRLQDALNSDARFLQGRSFQLILADNDVPGFVRGLHRKPLSREAPLLEDIPGLDDDELLSKL